jgi:hypothetical protein
MPVASTSNETLNAADVSEELTASFKTVNDRNVRQYFRRFYTQYVILKDITEMWQNI